MSQRSGNRKSSSRRNRKPANQTQRSANQARQSAAPTSESKTTQTTQASSARTSSAERSRRTSRKDVAQAQAKKQQQTRMIIGAVAAAALIAIIFIFVNRPSGDGVKIDYSNVAVAQSSIIENQGTPAAPATTDLTWSTGTTVGDPNAPVTFHIFSDFQCHFCKQFHDETLPQIVDDYVRDGKVKLVFHDFPRLGSDPNIANSNRPNFIPELSDGNNESSLASQAAMCAGEQDQYLEMSDKLFGNYEGVQRGGYKRSNLDRFASDLNLDTDAFKECMDSGRYVPALADSVTQGESQRITATPMFIIDNGNGTPNVVSQTEDGYDMLKKQIDLAIDTAP